MDIYSCILMSTSGTVTVIHHVRMCILIASPVKIAPHQAIKTPISYTLSREYLWPLLLTWFNFNPSMDK